MNMDYCEHLYQISLITSYHRSYIHFLIPVFILNCFIVAMQLTKAKNVKTSFLLFNDKTTLSDHTFTVIIYHTVA
jgi:hypothetical protein